jgi:hypothetical protein
VFAPGASVVATEKVKPVQGETPASWSFWNTFTYESFGHVPDTVISGSVKRS